MAKLPVPALRTRRRRTRESTMEADYLSTISLYPRSLSLETVPSSFAQDSGGGEGMWLLYIVRSQGKDSFNQSGPGVAVVTRPRS